MEYPDLCDPLNSHYKLVDIGIKGEITKGIKQNFCICIQFFLSSEHRKKEDLKVLAKLNN